MAMLGLTHDARINIRSKDIDITLIGDPKIVREMLGVVKEELEKRHRLKRLERAASGRFAIQGEHTLNTDSQVVRPTELDEMDSPYAIPEHRTVPPPGEEPTPTSLPGIASPEAPTPAGAPAIHDTIPAGALDDLPDAADLEDTGLANLPDIGMDDDMPDGEVTAINMDPTSNPPEIGISVTGVPSEYSTPLIGLEDAPPQTRPDSKALSDERGARMRADSKT